MRDQRVGVRLHEIGPRLSLELVKVQEGVCDGAVLFHAERTKTEEEAAEDAARRQARIDAKDARRKAQEQNVARKRAAKDEKAARRKRRRAGAGEGEGEGDGDGSDDGGGDGGGDASDEGGDDGGDEGGEGPTDEEWYRREVGAEPEPGMFGRAKGPPAPKSKRAAPERKHKVARSKARSAQ